MEVVNSGCCICLEMFGTSKQEKIVAPHCGHLVHENCLDTWLRQNQVCPQCRCAVSRRDNRRIFMTNINRNRHRQTIDMPEIGSFVVFLAKTAVSDPKKALVALFVILALLAVFGVILISLMIPLTTYLVMRWCFTNE